MNVSKLLGTESLSSLEDLPFLRSENLTPSQPLLFLIKSQSLPFPMPVAPRFSSAQLFALTWDVFQYHISEPTRDGFASVTDQSMISSEESDKDQLRPTCHTSITLCMEQSSALKSKSSLTSHLSSSTSETLEMNGDNLAI